LPVIEESPGRGDLAIRKKGIWRKRRWPYSADSPTRILLSPIPFHRRKRLGLGKGTPRTTQQTALEKGDLSPLRPKSAAAQFLGLKTAAVRL
jgi:hypothetical protein